MSVGAAELVDQGLAEGTALPAESGTLRGRWSVAVAVGVLVVALGASLAMHIWPIGHPQAVNYGATLAPPSLHHLFGTDDLGRDVFSRTVYATLLDMQVGFVTTLVPMAIGIVIGAVVGYVGGVAESLVMRLMDVILAFPFLVFVLAFVAIYGPGLTGIYVGLIASGIPVFVRLTRGEMLVLREQQFMLAARVLGLSRRRIVIRHALPHLVRTNLVYSLSNVVLNVSFLAALSYLGLGVRPPTPEWGTIIAEGQQYLLTAWWVSTLPGLFMVVLLIALYVSGEGLADWLHVRTTGAL